MLRSAREAHRNGVHVTVGIADAHGRAETSALLDGLKTLPRLRISQHGTTVEEPDTDALLRLRPDIAIIDDLAHTNSSGMRHARRFLDVQELLDAGIDVYTTLNVQDLESRAATIHEITGSRMSETIPDAIVARADEVKLVDCLVDEVLRRKAEGKVHIPADQEDAADLFFQPGPLTALRAMALRLTAERVEQQQHDHSGNRGGTGQWKSGHRLLVGVSASPASQTLIRAAHRMASAMHAPWIAVHVEVSSKPTAREESALRKNLDLAQELGAEIVSTIAENIPRALLHVAHAHHATQVLVGKPPRARLFGKGLVEELVERSGTLDILVLGELGEHGRRKGIRWPTAQRTSPSREFVLAAGIISAIALGFYPLRGVLGYQAVSLILLLAIALLPLRMGIGPVILAATLGAVIWDFFFIPPAFTLTIGHPADMLMLVLYFVLALTSAILISRITRRETIIRSRESRTASLYNMSRELSGVRSENAIGSIVLQHVRTIFNVDAAFFPSQIDGEFSGRLHEASTYRPEERELSVAGWSYWNERKAGKGTGTLPFAKATYYPLSGPRYPLGVLAVAWPVAPPPIEQESLLQMIIEQFSACLEREQLHTIAQHSLVHAESERLYATLFSSISHELRTPLASIMGSADALSGATQPDPETSLELVRHIHQSARELHQFVENLLDISRLESGLLKPRLDWVDVHDLVHATLTKTEEERAGHTTSIAIPDDLPLVRLDHTLMEQVLINIVRNAYRHTPGGTSVRITVSVDTTEFRCTIEDDGPGIPPDALPHIFTKFYRVTGTRTHGSGLGLSIARGFVLAHGGKIEAHRRDAGGSMFVISIPIHPATQRTKEDRHGRTGDDPGRG